MAIEWTWPLVTSVLRLIFISTLTVVNWAALYRVISTKKYKTGQRQERLLVTSIIVISLVYLTIVWAPFTFSALKHDLSDQPQKQENLKTDLGSHPFSLPDIKADLESDININAFGREKEDEFIVEYIDLADVTQDVPDESLEEITAKNTDFVSDDEDKAINDEVDEEFVVEYIDIRTGKPVRKVPQPRVARDATQQMEAAWTVFFHTQPEEGEEEEEEVKTDITLSPVKKEPTSNAETMNEGRRANSLSWNSYVQDLVTSSCAYSLAFTAVVRMVVMRRFVLCPDSPLVLGIWSGLVVGVPGAITLLIRTLGKTTGHFAPHQPEYTATGYFLYNIICDVHISEEYVVSVFLEWAVLFTLVLIALAVIFAVATKTNQGDATDSYGRLQDEDVSSSNNNNNNVEAWARDVVLMVGAIWSWPIKPVVVLILFCIYGSHWTNLVCWVAHVVVAIPVVFIPLAVFLSRPYAEKSPMDVYVIEEDPNLGGDTSQNLEKEEEVEEKRAKQEQDVVGKVQNTNSHDNNFEGQVDDDQGQGHTKENLKFYLGKDIFKYGLKPKSKEGKEDKRIILENEWGDTNFSEA